MTHKCDIGLIGLAVMGENLALNIESRGFSIAVYQPHHRAKSTNCWPAGPRARTSSAATRWKNWSAAWRRRAR